MKHKPYLPFLKYVLRTPLFPMQFIIDFVGRKEISEEEFKTLCDNKEVKEAIFLASPNLHTKLIKWLDNQITDKKEIKGLKESIGKYLLRMATRCTPFGLFSGCSLGYYSDTNNILLSEQKEYFRHTRLDMNFLCALAQDLAMHPKIKDNIKYYPNSSIYQIGEKLRFVEYRYVNSRRTHHIVAVDNSEYLQTIIKASKKGAYKRDLAELLIDDDISLHDAMGFMDELISSQVLINELEPTITGPEFMDQLLNVLENIDGIEEIIKIIKETKEELLLIDESPVGVSAEKYYQIVERLKSLETSFELKYMFQTDMIKPTVEKEIENTVHEDVWKAIELMNKFSVKSSKSNISQFKDAFYKRYEEAEVPLLTALDIESGIGYLQNDAATMGDVTPLIDDIMLPANESESKQLPWNNIQSFLLTKYNEAIKNNSYTVAIDENDIKKLPEGTAWDDLPLTISTMIKIVDYDHDKNEAIYEIGSAGGSSAANLLGRFGHADKNINDFVKEITQKEEELYADAIFAEIIHLSESRLGNILLRPVFRKYEIPYLAKSAVKEDFQISLDDLYISVKRNEIVLRSKKLNKTVVPRLSTAHNYSLNALPVYQFLCDMQTQGIRSGVGFNWGILENEYSFLPRLTYQNIILSTAKWNIKYSTVEKIFKEKDQETMYDNFQQWRKANNIPEIVLLSEGDNELYLNLSNNLCIQILISQVKKRHMFTLREFLFNTDKSFIKNNEGSFTNEFIVSFYKNKDYLKG